MSIKGYFRVYAEKDDIHFEQIELENGEVIPEDQLKLRDDVNFALTTIRVLFLVTQREKFDEYFKSLLSLAQLGLVGSSSNAILANRALLSLKHEILEREGGIIKNQYMKKLGIYAFKYSLPALCFGLLLNISLQIPIISQILTVKSFDSFLRGFIIIIKIYSADITILRSFAFLWVGCMTGVWLSFGSRKVVLSFDDLVSLENDRLVPQIRLCFAGFLTIIIGLLISTQCITFSLGELSTKNFLNDLIVPLLIGSLCGFSETVLSSKVTKYANDFIGIK